jgi:preprotein translocase subunit SecG
MSTFILGSLAGTLLGWLMGFLSVFLILLVLLQRGRGGGLTGALGGPGGQSAFGSKAGDTFTIITIVVATIWGFTCAFTMWLLGTHAPTTAMPANVTAGPGDDVEQTDPSGVVIPTPGQSSGEPGLSAIGENATSATETPSMELTPADRKLDSTEDESAESESAESETSESESEDEADAQDEPASDNESAPSDSEDTSSEEPTADDREGNDADQE